MAGLIATFPRPLWLYVLESTTCEACVAARPALNRLRAAHSNRVMVVELHVDVRDWTEFLGWSPRYTPGYALVDRDGDEKKLLKKWVGTMDYDELVAWIGPENLT
jgi:thiol-disulfide isomerase/thioredoxin